MRKSIIGMSAAFGIALAIAVAVLVSQGTGNSGIRVALGLTARWSFLLFWLAYAGNAVATLFEVQMLAGRGRDFGLAFACAHLVHVGLVIWLYRISIRPVLPMGLFVFFMLGLFWTYLLAGFSFGGVRAIGATAWRWVRFLGMNYILIAFGRDFVLPVVHPKFSQLNPGHYLFYAPFMVLTFAAPLLTLLAARRKTAAGQLMPFA